MKYLFQIAWRAVRKALHCWIYQDRIRRVAVEELPDSLQPRRLYVIGVTSPWSAAFLCPCGCGETIQISLLPDDQPTWSLSFDHDGLPTLSPSVWRTAGCCSHFFLRQGAILWCHAEGVRTTKRNST